MLVVLGVVAVGVTAIAAFGPQRAGTVASAPPTPTPSTSRPSSAAEIRANCLGASALAGLKACSGIDLGSTVYPDPTSASSDSALQYDCFTQTYAKLTSCQYGSSAASAVRVAFVGDNRAASLLPGVLAQLPAANWHLTTYLGDGCVLSTIAVARCSGAQKAIIDAVARKSAYDLVITTADRSDGLTSGSFATVFQRIRNAGTKLAVIADTPHPSSAALSCTVRAGVDPATQACDTARPVALLGADPLIQAASDSGATLVDMTKYFCTAARCPGIIGNVIVYRDSGADLTTTYSRTLGPFLVQAVTKSARL